MKYSLIFATFYLLGGIATSQANWPDIQRQYPQLQLQELETAATRLQVLRLPAQTAQPRGTLLVLPTSGRHPYSPDWFSSLQQLSQDGWQLVFLPASESLVADPGRQALLQTQLSTRWQALQSLIQRPLIVIAQGELAGVLQLAQETDPILAMDALISLGAYLPEASSQQLLQQRMAQTRLPLLDILTRADHPWSVNSAAQRQQLARTAQNPFYRQRALDEFSAHPVQQAWLQGEIRGWLRTSGF